MSRCTPTAWNQLCGIQPCNDYNMGTPDAPSGSASSDLFQSDDTDFLEALRTTVLPGDLPQHKADKIDTAPLSQFQAPSKRPRSPTPNIDHCSADESGADLDVYAPSRFGQFGEYMRRKRAKLQIQNVQLEKVGDRGATKGQIFRGLAIYVRLFFVGTSRPIDRI